MAPTVLADGVLPPDGGAAQNNVRHRVTPRTREILRGLPGLTVEVERDLHLASLEARNEWDSFQVRWPSVEDLAQGTMALSDDELEAMKAKVGRFRDILRGFATALVPGQARLAV
jgi:hypothetical protein